MNQYQKEVSQVCKNRQTCDGSPDLGQHESRPVHKANTQLRMTKEYDEVPGGIQKAPGVV